MFDKDLYWKLKTFKMVRCRVCSQRVRDTLIDETMCCSGHFIYVTGSVQKEVLNGTGGKRTGQRILTNIPYRKEKNGNPKSL